MSGTPARLSRAKRTSRERLEMEEADALFPTSQEASSFLMTHRTCILAVLVISWIWFAHVVAPLVPATPYSAAVARTIPTHMPHPSKTNGRPVDAGLVMATGSPLFGEMISADKKAINISRLQTPEGKMDLPDDEIRAFVLTCALVHTLIVSVGIALGHDTLAMRKPTGCLLRASGGAFVFLCATLWFTSKLKIGPVPVVCARLFSTDGQFAFLGALSATVWLCCSMLVPHSPLGLFVTSSSKMHLLVAAAGLGVRVTALSPSATLSIFAVAGGAGLLATKLAKQHAAPVLGSDF